MKREPISFGPAHKSVVLVKIGEKEGVKYSDLSAELKKENLELLHIDKKLGPEEPALIKKVKKHWNVYHPLKASRSGNLQTLSLKLVGDTYQWRPLEIQEGTTFERCYIVAQAS
jgi:hypothetical protein